MGHIVFGLYSPLPLKQDCFLISFPVKHNWYEKADLLLIETSANQLMDLLSTDIGKTIKKVLLPCPGCGNGQLDWREVKSVIAPILDDRVIAVDNGFPAKFEIS